MNETIKPKQLEPVTVLISKAINEAERRGYKVMVALADIKPESKDLPKEERLYTFCDIENKRLRKVIYRKIEDEYAPSNNSR